MTHIFVVSDATGATASRVLQAALTQFDAHITISRFGHVRTEEEIRSLVARAARASGFIVHTLVSEALRHLMLTEGRRHHVVTVDLMGPLLARLTELLASPPKAEPGLFRPFDEAYLQRIEAIDFTVRHDDGLNVHELDQAEIVLVGVSRTSKTPVSIYLAYRGWRVANVPLALSVEPPPQLFQLPRRRVVGLTIQPERLVKLRRVRAQALQTPRLHYADLEHVRQEVAYAYQIFERRRDWPVVDVTSKPVEETASEVVALLRKAARSADHRP